MTRRHHPPTPTPPPSIYTFEDNFTDLSKWHTEDYIGSGQEATFAASQSTVSGGILSITAKRKPGGWLSGCLVTDFMQQYGLFEARMKLPKGAGLWPAFWLLKDPWSMAGEIDILEALMGKWADWPISTVHFPPGEKSYGHRTADLSLAFHDYGAEWRAGYIAFTFDGTEFARFTDTAHIPAFPMRMILNLAVGGGWAGPSDATTPDLSLLSVDWVRVSR